MDNQYPHIGTAADYARYEAAVAAFFEGAKVDGISTPGQCLDCDEQWDDDGKCPDCGADRDIVQEPHFSWTPCDCCNRDLGGERFDVVGWRAGDGAITGLLSICTDCYYYSEYGQLDDMAMLEIEESATT